MNYKLILSLLSIGLLLGSCSNSGNGGSTPSTPDELEYTINFNAFQFEGKTSEISTSSSEGKFEDAIETIFTDSTEEGLFKSSSVIPYVGLKKYDYPKTAFTALQVGSGSTDGLITFSFNKKIVSVEITAQAYYREWMKTYELEEGEEPYPLYSIDLDTTIQIGSETWTLPEAYYDETKYEYHMPERETKKFTINSDSLTISDDENLGRFFIHSLKLVFEK